MNPIRIVALVIVVAGLLGLAYGSFSYRQEHTAAKVGPLELKVQETKTVNVPVWAGVAAIVVGGLVLVGTTRK